MRTLAVWLAITLITVEVCAQVATRYPPLARQLGAGTPTARRLVAQAQAAQASDDPMKTSGAGRIQWHPRWGWMNRPGERTNEGYTSTVNERGQRSTGPVGAGEIVVIGDSFTFGDEVDDDQSFAWILQERAGASVTNLGTFGYGLDQMLLRLRDNEDALHPRVVVLCLDGPVVLRNVLDWDVWKRPRFGLQGGRLIEPNLPMPSPAEALRDRPWLATWDVISLWREVASNPLRDDALSRAYGHALLAELNTSIRAMGATPLVVWLPMPQDITRAGVMPTVGRDIARSAPATADAFVDLSPALVPLAAAGVPIQRQVHWTPEAHLAIAEALAMTLAERTGLPR